MLKEVLLAKIWAKIELVLLVAVCALDAVGVEEQDMTTRLEAGMDVGDAWVVVDMVSDVVECAGANAGMNTTAAENVVEGIAV